MTRTAAAEPSTACWNCGTALRACSGDCCGACDHRTDQERGLGFAQSRRDRFALAVANWWLRRMCSLGCLIALDDVRRRGLLAREAAGSRAGEPYCNHDPAAVVDGICECGARPAAARPTTGAARG